MATSTNYTSIAYILETTEGEAPIEAPFEFQVLPTTGGSPVSNITTAVSEVIRDDRQTDDLVPVDASVSGDINFELSHDPYQPWLKALLQNDTTTSINTASITTDGASATTLAVSGIDTDIDIGDVFQLTSLTDDTVNGTYACISNSTPGEIEIDPPMPTPLTIIADGEATTDTIITNGADAPKSYTIRKTALEGGITSRWYYYGCRINSMNFNFSTGSILNGSIGIVGRTETTGTSLLTNENAVDLPVPSYSIMNSVSSIGTIYLEGISLGTCKFSSLDLTYDNQTNEAKSIGTLGACATSSFSVNITGNVEVYFKDLSLYNKFKNAESFGITIVLNDGANGATDTQSIGINMPKCKFETLDTPISGKDTFLMQSGSFRSLRDETDNYMFKMCFVDKA